MAGVPAAQKGVASPAGVSRPQGASPEAFLLVALVALVALVVLVVLVLVVLVVLVPQAVPAPARAMRPAPQPQWPAAPGRGST